MLRIVTKTLGLLSLIVFLCGLYVAYDIYRFLKATFNLTTPQVYFLAPGQSAYKLADDLKQQGLVTNAFYARQYIRWQSLDTMLQAGEYVLIPGMLFSDLLADMREGKSILRQITFIEGWTFADMLSEIAQSPYIRKTNIDSKTIMQQLGAEQSHPEGQFFPDSYAFKRGTRDIDILNVAWRSMQQKLAQAWQQRHPDLPYKTPYEALIAASIIEKEAQVSSERGVIAGVIVNRLRKKMRLQLDPTVVYGLGDRYSERLRKADLLMDTPYNTYTNFGLPPTPIAMPSYASLLAATQPQSTRYIYFVAKGDGSHHFSETLAEQNQAVRKYILGKRS